MRMVRLALVAAVFSTSVTFFVPVGATANAGKDDIEITDGDDSWIIGKGDLIDLYIRHVNADPEAVGVLVGTLRSVSSVGFWLAWLTHTE